MRAPTSDFSRRLRRGALAGVGCVLGFAPCLLAQPKVASESAPDADSAGVDGPTGEAARETPQASVGSDAPLFIEFSYEAPGPCMSEEQAFSLVQRRSHRVRRMPTNAGGEEETQQHLTMVVTRTGREYRGQLIVRRAGHAPESRSMVGLSCDDLVEGLALTAALSIDPNATVTLGGAPESEPAPVLAPEVPTVVTQAESELPGDAPGSDDFAGSDGTGLRVVLGGLVTAQKVVDQTVLVGGGVQLLLSGSGNRAIFPFEFRLSVEGLADPRNRDGADIFTDMVMIGGAYCPLRIGTPHSFSICAAADLGALFAQSRGFEQSGEVGRFFASAALEGWFRARLSERVELWVSPALTVPLTERQFAVEPGPEILSSTVTVGWSGSIGVAWRF